MLGSPYIDELNTNVAGFFERAGFEILARRGMGLHYDAEMIRVAPEYLIEFAAAIDRPEADARQAVARCRLSR